VASILALVYEYRNEDALAIPYFTEAAVYNRRKIMLLLQQQLDIAHRYNHTLSIAVLDLIGRIGGEEFLVLFPCTDLAAAKQLADPLQLYQKKP